MLGALGKIGVVGNGIPLPRRVRNILSKYDATLLMPGASGVAVQTFAPGNFIESTGQTLTPVDGAVGLVVDAAGSLGEELFSDATASFGGEASRVSPGVYRILSTAGAFSVVNLINKPAGKTFEISFSVDSVTVAGTGLSIDPGGVPVSAGVGSKRVVLVSASTTIGIKRAGTACDIQISSISVREITGIHATKPTTQNKPALRRGLVNLLTYSNGFSNAAWNKTGTTVAGNKLVSSVGDSARRVSQNASLVSGQTYTAAMIVEKAEWNYAYFNGPESAFTTRDDVFLNLNTGVLEVNTNNRGSVLALGNGRYLLTYTRTATASISESFRYGYSATTNILSTGDGTSGIYLHSAALFQGTVTAEEILANGGIPVTTSAPASSAIGPQYWQFDGVDDLLQLSAVPFQMADDHFVVVGATADIPSLDRRIFACAAPGGENGFQLLRAASNGRLSLRVQDDTAVKFRENVNLATPLNSPFVGGYVKNGSTFVVHTDATESSVLNFAHGVLVLTQSSIAGFMNHWSGQMHAIIIGKGVITAAEMQTLKKFVAKLQGRSL